jgi:hypothetical protein
MDEVGHLDVRQEISGLFITHLPDGKWDVLFNTWADGGSPTLNLYGGVTLAANFSPVDGSGHIELRNYGDGPGFFWGDSTLWANADVITVTPVGGPPLTPVPEPVITSLMAALGLCGFIGWRRWLQSRAGTERTAA